MLAHPGTPCYGTLSFSPASKCCTHHPELPNYLVGALLSDTSPASAEGKSRIREKIQSRIGITPFGILRPVRYALLISNSNTDYFGRSRALICPLYDAEKGACTVAPHWDAICSSWFCKYVSGEDGRKFWLAIRKYLEGAEQILRRYPLLEMGLDLPEPENDRGKQKPLTLEELDDLPLPQSEYAALWGDWSGREEEFYLETYRIVAPLDRHTFKNIEGTGQKYLLRDVEKKFEAMMSAPVPEKLQRNVALNTIKLPGDFNLLTAYSPFDPLKLSGRLNACLHYFDGSRSNSDVIGIVRKELGISLSPHILQKLYRFRILTNPQTEK